MPEIRHLRGLRRVGPVGAGEIVHQVGKNPRRTDLQHEPLRLSRRRGTAWNRASYRHAGLRLYGLVGSDARASGGGCLVGAARERSADANRGAEPPHLDARGLRATLSGDAESAPLVPRRLRQARRRTVSRDLNATESKPRAMRVIPVTPSQHAHAGVVDASARAFGKRTLFSRCTCAWRSSSKASSSCRHTRYVVQPSSGTT